MNYIQQKLQSMLGLTSAPQKVTSKKRMTSQINVTTPEDRVKMEMNELRRAVEEALWRQRPDRRNLLAIYLNTDSDSHVLSQVEIAKAKLCGEQFIISRGGVDDVELSTSFKTPWFEEYIKCCFDALIWGYTLIEFGQFVNGSWSDVQVFPRRHVEAFSKKILLRPGDTDGIYYGDKPQLFYLMEIGKPTDLGLYKIISREVIWKNFSRTDWSHASEKFGMPLVYVKTSTDDKDELDRIEALCKNFGTNGYVIVNSDDDVSILETASKDIHKIYLENARFCDEQISKCINGQTGTSDVKAFVGSAEVHERILEDLHAARLRYISNLTNYTLFPFLMYHGFQLEGCSIRFPALDFKVRESQNDNDTEPETEPEDPTVTQQKKKPAATLKLPSWVIDMRTV